MNKNLPYTTTSEQKSCPACMVTHLSNYTCLQRVYSNVLNSEHYLKYFIQRLSVSFTWPLSSQRNNAPQSQNTLLYIWIIMIWHSRGNMLWTCHLILRSNACWNSSMCDKSKAFPCMKVILPKTERLVRLFHLLSHPERSQSRKMGILSTNWHQI